MSAVPFDRSVLKVNQVILVTAVVAAWGVGLRQPLAAAALPALAIMMLAGAAWPATLPARALYLRLLRPLGLVRPRVVVEDPAPHRFAQLLGGVVLAVASLVALAGALLAAWTLAWLVVVLALLNLVGDVCVGCLVYAQLVRAGILPQRRAAA